MEYQSNVNIVIDQIKQRLSVPNIDLLISTISQYLYSSNLKRIHTEGKNVNGAPIGRYSTKPIYVNPKRSPKKFTPAGKGNTKGGTGSYSIKTKKEVTSSAIFKNGRPRHTRYFNTGYYGFRRQIGRDFSRVNLQLTGSLMASWNLKKLTLGADIGFLSANKTKIAEAMEKHFGCKIWGITQEDRQVIAQIVNNFIKQANA